MGTQFQNRPGQRGAPRLRLVFGVILAAILLLLLSGIAYFFTVTQSTQKQLEQEFRGAGFALSLDELVPVDEGLLALQQLNTPLQRAINAVDNASAETTRKLNEIHPVISGPVNEIDDDTWRIAESVVEDNGHIFELLIETGGSTPSPFPIDLRQGPAITLPHLASLRKCARLLRIDATVAARDDDWARYEADMKALFALARSIETEPILISQLSHSALHGVIIELLGQTMSMKPMPAELLAAIDADLKSELDLDPMRTALYGEIVNMYSMTVAQRGSPTTMNDPVAFLSSMRFVTLPPETPWHEVLEQSERDRDIGGMFSTLTSIIAPALHDSLFGFARGDAQLRSARIAIAVEQFRLENDGDLPETLGALVPEYMERIPLDPFDGEPLRYTIADTGYIVYTVYRDFKDDGGTPPTRGQTTPGDWPFVVTR